MTNQLNTLIIEDHPFIAEGYIRVLEAISSKHSEIDFKISIANNCEEAAEKIKFAINHCVLDLVFLDISLTSKNCRILSGEDLGLKIKQAFSGIKLIITTSLYENHILCNIF